MIRSTLLELIASPQLGLILMLIKISIVFGLGFVLAYLFRHRSAAVRHFLWMTTLLGALTVPLVTRVVPQWEWPAISDFGAGPIVTNVNPGTPSPGVPDLLTKDRVDASPATAEPAISSFLSVSGVWLAGVLLVTIWCVLGHLAFLRMARRARPVTDPDWLCVLQDASRHSDLTEPVRLFVSPRIDSPMTWGHRRPIVLLPEIALEWSPERRRVVLLHELAHIARKDFLVQFVASMTCALYWFHPGAWAAARRLRDESEHACDDRAIQSGTPAADYASHLLCLALQSRARHWPEAMAIGLTRPSTLEARVRAVLDEDLTRRSLSARARVGGSIALLAVVLVLSSLTPVRAAFDDHVLEGPVGHLELGKPAPDEPDETQSTDMGVAVANTSKSTTSETSNRTISHKLDAHSGEELDLKLQAGGNVEIEGWDEPMVEVHAHVDGPDAEKILVDVDRTSKGVKVHCYFTEHSRVRTSSNDFKIRVPRRFDLRLDSSGGHLHMSNVEGTFEGDTGGGEIKLDHVKGHANLDTGGGDIRVSDSNLTGDVNTGGGRVDLIRVRGGLIGTSGSGPVWYNDSEQASNLERLGQKLEDLGEDLENLTERAFVSKSGSSIVLDEIRNGANMSTGGGDVEIGRTTGPVVVSTGGGDMEIGPVNGSLHASTGAGDIRVLVAATDETVELTSGSGRVVLELPASWSGRIDLETGYTKSFGRTALIESDWKLTQEATTEWDGRGGQTPRRYIRAHGTLGDGRGRVRVTTVNGDIELRRTR